MSFKTKFFAVLFLIGLSAPATMFAADYTIIDVRTEAEYLESHLIDALLIDIKKPNFIEEISKLDKNRAYKVYCRSGNRSRQAVIIMQEEGFTDLEDLGSMQEASQRLNQPCEGFAPSC